MSEANSTKVITIDGPAGAGKSTVARALAERLKFFYLDTGAMYRALTLKAIRNNVDFNDEESLIQLAQSTTIQFQASDNAPVQVMLDGEDVSEAIRTVEVTNQTSAVASKKGVRAIMVGWQREIGSSKNVVIEGRDVGTVVFPQATTKFFLEADLQERTSRRLKELKEKGAEVNEAALKEEIHTRDESDKNRDVGPLKKADDAIVVNSTNLSPDEVVEEMCKHISS